MGKSPYRTTLQTMHQKVQCSLRRKHGFKKTPHTPRASSSVKKINTTISAKKSTSVKSLSTAKRSAKLHHPSATNLLPPTILLTKPSADKTSVLTPRSDELRHTTVTLGGASSCLIKPCIKSPVEKLDSSVESFQGKPTTEQLYLELK